MSLKKIISQNPNKISERELQYLESVVIDVIAAAPEEVFRRVLLRLVTVDNLALIRASLFAGNECH